MTLKRTVYHFTPVYTFCAQYIFVTYKSRCYDRSLCTKLCIKLYACWSHLCSEHSYYKVQQHFPQRPQHSLCSGSADRNSPAIYNIVIRKSHAELPAYRYQRGLQLSFCRNGTALHCILDNKSILNKPILVTVWSKGTTKLAAEPTPHNSLDRLHTRSKNQPLYCL
jgi:hypothetical protein